MVKKGTFKKGQSGNPAGRPKKGQTLTDILMKNLDKEEFIQMVIAGAKAGDTSMQKYIWDRIDGKVVERIEQHNTGETNYIVIDK